jgi:carboxymethylenebutenolidase
MDIYHPRNQGTGPGVILTFQLFGVDEHIRGLADRLAALGYTVAVPNLYHRAGVTELPMDDDGRQRGFELLNGLTREGVLADLAETIKELPDGPIGIVGLSMGAHIAWLAAAELPITAAAVLFPGWLTGTAIPLSRPEPTVELTSKIGGSVLLLAGDQDHVLPAADVRIIQEALTTARVRHEVVLYPGVGHAFFFAGASTYDADAANDAWRRIGAFLDTELTPVLD